MGKPSRDEKREERKQRSELERQERERQKRAQSMRSRIFLIIGTLAVIVVVILGITRRQAQTDMPAEEARALLGPDLLVGLSTHDVGQVVLADEASVDYLGFGPVHPTGTKGYSRGLGPEACWIAAEGTHKPLFPIGGIGVENAADLARVGRAAVGSAILSAPDPAQAARAIRAALEAPAD
jgi:thiamine-phosphate pyrophosphorylase